MNNNSENIYERTINTLKSIPNLKTKDVDDLAKKYIKENVDVEGLYPYIETSGAAYRIYFQINLKKLDDLYKQIEFIEKNSIHFGEWWHIDILLQFLKQPVDCEYLINKAEKYVNSELPFVRRLGYVLMLANPQKETKYFERISKLFHNDDEYYVQMAEAWLIADLCVYSPDKTYEFIKTCGLNYKILSKAISKICDSFRISDEIKNNCRALREIVKNN